MKNKFFAGFSVEKVTEIQQREKRWHEKESLEVDQEIEEFFELYSIGAHRRRTNSDVELFPIEDKEKGEESGKNVTTTISSILMIKQN